MSPADGGLGEGRGEGETGKRGGKEQTQTTQMQILGALWLNFIKPSWSGMNVMSMIA